MKSGLFFVKMQATGNDFILADARDIERDWSKLAKAMCHRHFGVGADGLILLLPSKIADFSMRMFNPDGSEAEACGNGLRCFFKYVRENKFVGSRELRIETSAGVRIAQAEGEKVRVGMGMPKFAPADIPLTATNFAAIPILDYAIEVAGKELKLDIVSMGNPHAVSFLSEPVDSFPLSEFGPGVENHPLFPQRANFEVANIISRNKIQARVWERGAGETLSCGSGACAIAVAAKLHNLIDDKADIILPGGTLTVDWDGEGEVYLSGTAEVVFKGEWIK